MKTVYLINGFLESGKTEFIHYTLDQEYFQIRGKTLILLCEEGEVEYSKELLQRSHSVVELIEEETDFNSAHLMDLEKKHKPERIIIEWNGMWNMKAMKLPFHWKLEQQVTTIDASTFSVYFSNMKSLLAEMIRKSELIIFNRCDDIEDLSSYKRSVKAVNQSAEIIFEDSEGEINELMEEELPFDLNADVIDLGDREYGIWFMDCLDHLSRYEGKKIRFLANVLKPDGFVKGRFVPGRAAMTCCAEDIAFLGFVCKYDQSDSLKNKDWVTVTAEVHEEYWEDYKGKGPVLTALKVESAIKPKEEMISFT